MKKDILSFSEIDESAFAMVGGKGANLARMTRAGVAVPLGFCLTTDLFWQFLTDNNLKSQLSELARAAAGNPDVEQLTSALADLRHRISTASLSHRQTEALKQAIAQLQDSSQLPIRFAVRSSATSEDLAEASFAGQYDTFLNISDFDEMLASIKDCFASYWNDRAFSYRVDKRIDHFEHGMAVVVQQLIEAESAGVLFTINPLTGNEREMVIESCWGLGEALVSGLVSPDRSVVDPFQLTIIEQQPGNQKIKLISVNNGNNGNSNNSGVCEVKLSEAEVCRFSLEPAAVLELAAMAREIQRHYGYPLDIEWAYQAGRFFILQARPLTTLSFAAELGQWTSANFREVMPGLVNPLSFTLSLRYDYGNALDEFFHRIGLRREQQRVEWSRRFFGRAYWNVSIVKEYAAKLPGFNERAFDNTIGIEPDYPGDGRRTTLTPGTILRALPVFFRLKWLYFSFWREAARYEQEFAGIEAALSALDPALLNDRELVEQTREMIDLHYRTNRIALICSFLATESQSDFRQYVDKINQKLAPDQQISIANLLTGLTSLSTAEPLIELWQLAAEARRQPAIVAAIGECEPDEILYVCRYLPEGEQFAARLTDYLHRFRFLAANDEDLSCPRWADDAIFPLTILKNYLLGEAGENPAAAIARQQQCREVAEQAALSQLGPLRRWFFRGKLRQVARYCRWRETTRISLSKTYYHCRRVFNELGLRLTAQGLLAAPTDIYWLEREELLALFDGSLTSAAANQRIDQAKLIAESYRNFNPPTTIGQGVKLNQPVSQTTGEDGLIFHGVACSAGVVTARARIIRSLGEASRLARGEILIAPHTNPGWTPLFSLAAAVVLEEGGLLSHGAVVARECGIPTVLQLKAATEIFHDGQLLRVDGSRGTVEIIEE